VTRPRSRRGVPAVPPARAPLPPALDAATVGLAAAVAVMAATLYVLTAARDIVVGDTADLVTAALTLGVAHAPGYPLLTMLGHAFSWLPVGPAAFRVNLVACACDAAAVGVTFVTATRLTTDRIAACVAALLLATSPLFWRWSLADEAFPLNNLLASVALYGLVRWQEQPDRSTFLVVAALATGLGLSNHLTIVLLGPAILFLLWRERRVLIAHPRMVALCAGAVLLGLLPYLYIPLAAAKDPFLNTGRVSSLATFTSLVTRADYGSAQLVAEAANAGGTVGSRWLALGRSFTPVEGLLIVLGAIRVFRDRRWYFWFTALAFGVAGPAFLAYANLDLGQVYGLFVLERFFLLSHVVLSPLAAVGLVFAADLLAARLRGRLRLVRVALLLLAVAAAGVVVAANYRAIDQHDNHVARTYAEDILATLEPHAILLGSGDDVVFPVTYVQAVEHVRLDVTTVWLSALRGTAWYAGQLRARDPDLVLPSDRAPGSYGPAMKALVDANRSRPIALVGPPIDQSLKGSYYGAPRGLVTQIESVSTPTYLDTLVRAYDELMPRYRVPSASQVKPGTFEPGILRRYAIPAHVVGVEYERAHDPASAAVWYRRALEIDPGFGDARDGLARVTAQAPRE